MYLNCDLGGARRVASQPLAKITIDPEPCMTVQLEKLRKSESVFGRLLSLSATYFQGSAMAAAGERRGLRVSISLERAVR